MYGKEDAFSEVAVRFFKRKLATSEFSNVSVERKLNILKDFTFVKDKRGWDPFYGSQEQDVVFYRDVLDPEILHHPIHGIGTSGRKLVAPLVICELKLGGTIDTHQILTYARISEEIKSIFPHMAYFLVLDSSEARRLRPATISRQAKGFDRVFLEWEEDRKTIWGDIKGHLEYLKRIKIL